MVTKRRSIHTPNSRLNFRAGLSDIRNNLGGTKPTTTPASVKEIFMLTVLHVCKKSLFFDTNLKVALYLGTLFAVSLIADVFTIPKTYLSRSDNILNQYFVKFAWGWNLTLLIPYVILTSYTYCCGQKDKIIKHHIFRIIIATFFWWFWTSSFNFIEARYGKCTIRGTTKTDLYSTKQTCLKAGHFWNGFDLSGHCFILIYGSLFLIEETRSLVNWDSIKEYIRLEEHYRSVADTSQNTNPLRSLTDEQFKLLQISYERFTPYIRGLFVVITLFQILWDVMLFSTMLYYHVMIEKFLGGVCAILTWFFTYRWWFNSNKFIPNLPGEGLFKYIKSKSSTSNLSADRRRTGSIVNDSRTQLPKFMGLPLHGLRTESGNSPTNDDLVR